MQGKRKRDLGHGYFKWIVDVVNYWNIFSVEKKEYIIILKEKTAPLTQSQKYGPK